jgi:hypothetical protein
MSVYTNTRSNKPELVKGLTTDRKIRPWVSATKTFNYIRKDPLIDWLSTYKRKPELPSITFTNFLCQQGIKFEQNIIQYIEANISPVVKIDSYYSESSVKLTVQAIKDNVPIIYSAPLKNGELKCYGVADLIIRKDMLPLFFSDKKYIESLNLEGDYYIIDIKYSSLKTDNDLFLKNEDKEKCYKVQLWLYNKCIEKHVKTRSKHAFILGRKNVNGGPFDLLGVVDLEQKEPFNIAELSRTSIKWVQDVKMWGNNWCVDPPCKPELYPNMKNKMIPRWISVEKNRLAESLGEITSIYYCGVIKRNKALSNGVVSWRDKRCNSKILGLGGKIGYTVDRILEINRQDDIKFLPTRVSLSLPSEKVICFVDFETLSEVFEDMEDVSTPNTESIIFCIGLYIYYTDRKKCEFKQFICNDNTHDEEFRIMSEFVATIRKLQDPWLFYWYADKMMWFRATKRHHRTIHLNLKRWYDLYTVFKDEPIVIKGCFDFKLKSIISSLNANQLIKFSYEDSEVTNGMDAQIIAWKYYNNKSEYVEEFNKVAYYNKLDCKALYFIYKFISRISN